MPFPTATVKAGDFALKGAKQRLAELWTSLEKDLPSTFGFRKLILVFPKDPSKGMGLEKGDTSCEELVYIDVLRTGI